MSSKNINKSFQQVTKDLTGSESLLKLHDFCPKKFPFILQSVTSSSRNRYSILFAYPQQTHILNSLSEVDSFIAECNVDFSNNKTEAIDVDIPFTGGWFCYWSYEYAQVIEPVLKLARSDLPLAIITRIPATIVLDHIKSKIHFIVENSYSKLLPQLIYYWQKSQSYSWDRANKIQVISQSEEDVNKFLSSVEKIKKYIVSGDVFQVNLSRRWQFLIDDRITASQVYSALCRSNPAPFAALADFDSWAIISSSPERLALCQAVKNDFWLDIRPIAGTRKRTGLAEYDVRMLRELIENSKERAEHIMLLDLGRNDLGRICQTGSIAVNELMRIETYEHVHHIVSNITGKLLKKVMPFDILHAIFPGGTITGCPKVRCMEIIAELEQAPRDAYTGSLGYLNRDGTLDTNILIRSFIQRKSVDNLGNRLDFRAGAGIVADSVAKLELKETKNKALGLLRALNL